MSTFNFRSGLVHFLGFCSSCVVPYVVIELISFPTTNSLDPSTPTNPHVVGTLVFMFCLSFLFLLSVLITLLLLFHLFLFILPSILLLSFFYLFIIIVLLLLSSFVPLLYFPP